VRLGQHFAITKDWILHNRKHPSLFHGSDLGIFSRDTGELLGITGIVTEQNQFFIWHGLLESQKDLSLAWEALDDLIPLAFNERAVSELKAVVFKNNLGEIDEPTLTLYKKLGFEEVKDETVSDRLYLSLAR